MAVYLVYHLVGYLVAYSGNLLAVNLALHLVDYLVYHLAAYLDALTVADLDHYLAGCSDN